MHTIYLKIKALTNFIFPEFYPIVSLKVLEKSEMFKKMECAN